MHIQINFVIALCLSPFSSFLGVAGLACLVTLVNDDALFVFRGCLNKRHHVTSKITDGFLSEWAMCTAQCKCLRVKCRALLSRDAILFNRESCFSLPFLLHCCFTCGASAKVQKPCVSGEPCWSSAAPAWRMCLRSPVINVAVICKEEPLSDRSLRCPGCLRASVRSRLEQTRLLVAPLREKGVRNDT